MVIFYKKWKKNNEIQITKNKMDGNNKKMNNHLPSPDARNKQKHNLVLIKIKFDQQVIYL